MDRIEVMTVKHEVPRQCESKAKKRCQPSATTCIEGAIIGNGNNAHPGDSWLLTCRPLTHREIGDLMARFRQELCQSSIPVFGTADGPGVESIVSNTDVEPRHRIALRVKRQVLCAQARRMNRGIPVAGSRSWSMSRPTCNSVNSRARETLTHASSTAVAHS